MKNFIILSAFVFLGSAFASAKEELPSVKVPVEEGFRPMDMNEFKDIEDDSAHTNIVVTCKLPSGKVLEKGDKGFEKCVSRANSQKKKPLQPRRERP